MTAPASGVISLITDFGTADTYAGQLHATLLRGHPAARVVDLSHGVPPGAIATAVFHAEAAWPAFAPGAVHMVVVDPGVGSSRRILAIATAGAWLVGPDTGVLSGGLPPEARPQAGTAAMPLPAGLRAVEISTTPVRAPQVSTSFHGRDIMAPVAARLAAGVDLADLGDPLTSVQAIAPLAARLAGGAGEARILHIDRFGNAITSIRGADAGPAYQLECAAVRVDGPAPSYAEGAGAGAIALTGSAGYVEIAWPMDNAAERLGLTIGDPLTIRPR